MAPPETHTPGRLVRLRGDLWRDFGAAVDAMGTDRSAVLRAFVAWYLRKPGAKLPKRPPEPEHPETGSRAQPT